MNNATTIPEYVTKTWQEGAFPGRAYRLSARVALPILRGLEQGADKLIRLGAGNGTNVAFRNFNLKIWPAATTWNKAGLYIAAKVHGTTPRGFNPASDKADWQCDCVELYFNPTINNQFTHARYGPADFHVICSVHGGKNTRDVVHLDWRGVEAPSAQFGNTFVKPHSIRMHSIRNARGYRVVIFVPWTDFPPTFKPKAGSFMGFSLSVRDMPKLIASFVG
ncbi:MAG: hypothetical protein HKL95_01040 [Phycisphaerae bacterium]|nr:hypothetical protein [Phycisphaerae bacterium]